MLALWGDAGIAAATSATPLDARRVWATNVTGGPIASGHYLPEEAPEETAKALKAFFIEQGGHRAISNLTGQRACSVLRESSGPRCLVPAFAGAD